MHNYRTHRRRLVQTGGQIRDLDILVLPDSRSQQAAVDWRTDQSNGERPGPDAGNRYIRKYAGNGYAD